MFALANNTGGSLNTANGTDALNHNTTAFFNTAMGSQAMFNNRTGLSNTANGYQALFSNETGGSNTATGVQALFRTTGGGNIALGFQAGVNLTTGSNNIDIGNSGVRASPAKSASADKARTTALSLLASVAWQGPEAMWWVNAMGKLGVAASSARFKDDIKPINKASEAIHALKPVTFRYKKEVDPEGVPQFGLVAEEVEKVNPDLVVRDAEGEVYTVRYEAVNAMLLNEFLKEHREVAELKSTVAEQRKGIEAMAAQLKEQAAQIQKMSAQFEASKAAPQVVNNPQSRAPNRAATLHNQPPCFAAWRLFCYAALRFLEVARVLVRFDQVAGRVVNANHSIL
jgi:trimeric autotransporter adhesin